MRAYVSKQASPCVGDDGGGWIREEVENREYLASTLYDTSND